MSPDRLTHSNQSIHHYQLGVFGGGNLDSCTSIQAEQLYIKKRNQTNSTSTAVERNISYNCTRLNLDVYVHMYNNSY